MSRSWQYAAVSSALLAVTICGMHISWGSPSFPLLYDKNNSETFHVTMDQSGWITTMQSVSGLCMTFVSGSIVDCLGRKTSIISSMLPYTIAWVLIAVADSPIYLYVAKILSGIGDTIVYTAIPLYIGEISDSDIRGFLAAGMGSFQLLGMLLINIIGTKFSIATTAWISLGVPFLFLITFVWMPDSPYYLLDKGKVKACHAALKKLKGDEMVLQEVDRLQSALVTHHANGTKVSDLFKKKSNRKGLLALIILRHSQQFTGHIPMDYYMVMVFQQSHIQMVTPETATIIYCTLQLITAALSSLAMDRFGRRPMLMVSLLGVCSALFLSGTIEVLQLKIDYLSVASLIAFTVWYSLGTLSVTYIMIGELFPTSVSAYASAFDQFYYEVLAAGTGKAFQVLDEKWGLGLPFLIFAVLTLFNVVCVYFWVPETKKKTLEEIQNEMSGKA